MAQDHDAVLNAAAVQRWAAAPGVLWRLWGDEAVAYLPASASTHLLEGNAATVLDLLATCGSQLSEAELLQQLVDGDADSAAKTALRAVLDNLVGLGLAESPTL